MKRTAIAALALIAVAGCSGGAGTSTGTSTGSGTTASQANSGPQSQYPVGTIAIGGLFASVNFNPWLSPNGANGSLNYTTALYDSLTRLTGPDTVSPDLATSWTFTNPDTLQMTLRAGVTFPDGTPLNAAAVAANIAYAKTASPGGQLNQFVTNLTTTVVNPTTIRFTSPTPDPDLPYDFATGGGFIVEPKALADPSKLATTPDGSGPYTLSTSGTIPGIRYTLTRRPGYWDASAYPYSTIELWTYASPQAMNDALLSGQIQVEQGTPASSAQGDTKDGVNLVVGEQDTVAGIWLNDRSGALVKALGNVRVRQALNYAIDRQAIVKAAFGADGTADSLIVGPGQEGYNAQESYPYDPAKAKQLLAQAGYPNGFTLPVLSTQSGDLMVQAVAGELAQIGVNVQISDHNTDFVQQAFSGNWPAMVFDYTISPVAQTLAEMVSPDGLGNPRHSTNPQIDGLLQNLAQTTGQAQATVANQLVGQINSQGWFLIVAAYGLPYTMAKNVSCSNLGLLVCMLPSLHPAG
jgi:peptide/nickel transport system substrate-binding protein